MGRIRTLKPEFFRSRSLARCPIEARLTFAGLWTEADDHGRGVADPRILKGALWALDDDVTHLHVSAHLDVLVDTGHIRLYESGGETYYEVINWTAHQAAAYRRGEPRYPAPEGYLDAVSHERVQESAGGTQESAGTGNEEQGTGNEEQPSAKADRESIVNQFAEFWDAYPRGKAGKPGGDGPRKPALARWMKLTDEERDLCMKAVGNYAEHIARPDSPNAAHVTTWLNQARWEIWQEPAEPTGPASIEDEWSGIASGKAQL